MCWDTAGHVGIGSDLCEKRPGAQPPGVVHRFYSGLRFQVSGPTADEAQVVKAAIGRQVGIDAGNLQVDIVVDLKDLANRLLVAKDRGGPKIC